MPPSLPLADRKEKEKKEGKQEKKATVERHLGLFAPQRWAAMVVEEISLLFFFSFLSFFFIFFYFLQLQLSSFIIHLPTFWS